MKQLQTEIIALCDYSLVDQQGKVSIIGIFDEFRVEKFPTGFIDKFLVATIHGEPSTPYKLTIEMEKDNNKHNLLRPTIVDTKTSPNGKTNLIIRLTNVGFEKEGDYFFKIYNGNELVGSTHLKVIRIQKPEERTVHLTN